METAMTLRELNLCVAETRGYRAAMGRMFGRVVGVWLVCAVGALVGASSASALPFAAVGGVQDPASSGELKLSVLANESQGLGLTSATALLDGQAVATTDFLDGTCRDGSDVGCPAVVMLTVPTAGHSDGMHSLKVIVENELGEQFEWERLFEVDNTPPVSTPVVTVSVGSNAVLPGPPPGGGTTPPPAGERGCAAPRLSMFLAQRPLRFRRGVPVLVAGRSYRYTGNLTCRIDGRRRPAPRGTEVQIRNRVNGHTITQPSVRVRRNGLIIARLAYRTSRTIVFRVRGTNDSVVRVRIPIRVVKVKRGRR